jgi:hypothetical protein
MDFPARGADVRFCQIIWGEFVLASEGDHEGRPYEKSGFVGAIPCGRPRQNRQWFPIHHRT